MKNALAYVKANKTVIIKTTLIAAATVTAITLASMVASGRFADDVVIEATDEALTITNP